MRQERRIWGGSAATEPVSITFDVVVDNPEGTASASFTEVEVEATASDSETENWLC